MNHYEAALREIVSIIQNAPSHVSGCLGAIQAATKALSVTDAISEGGQDVDHPHTKALCEIGRVINNGEPWSVFHKAAIQMNITKALAVPAPPSAQEVEAGEFAEQCLSAVISEGWGSGTDGKFTKMINGYVYRRSPKEFAAALIALYKQSKTDNHGK